MSRCKNATKGMVCDMRIIDDDDVVDDEQDEDVEEHKQRQIIWDLIQTHEGRCFLAENAAKNCYEELINRLEGLELSNAQIMLLKSDMLHDCMDVVINVPHYLTLDLPVCKKMLHRHLSTLLGIIVERMELKYRILLSNDESSDYIYDKKK